MFRLESSAHADPRAGLEERTHLDIVLAIPDQCLHLLPRRISILGTVPVRVGHVVFRDGIAGVANGLFDIIRALGHSSHVDSGLEIYGVIEIRFCELEVE